MTLSVLFVFVGGLLLFSTFAAFVAMGRLVLSGRTGLEGDGIEPGRRAPTWSSTDQGSHRRQVPSGDRWQMLIFTDHSLSGFPSVVEGLSQMLGRPAAPEVIVVADETTSGTAVHALPLLGLDVPVVGVPTHVYHQYNVRVMPWVFFVDPAGAVQASSLVNHAWQLEKLWAIARARVQGQRRLSPLGHVPGAA